MRMVQVPYVGSEFIEQKGAVKLRLRLFDTVVTPTAIYSLSTTPLTTIQLAKLDAVQRKMLRRIIGWIRFDDEEWETTGQRMKARLDAALHLCPMNHGTFCDKSSANEF